jgi:purine nucleoside phosphorylase
MHRWGPRFFSMHNAYDPSYIKAACEVLKQKNLPQHVGVYTALGGPQFETVAELKFLLAHGVDAVGKFFSNISITLNNCL